MKGLGYMSFRLRVPNFPNSAGISGPGFLGKLGSIYLYQFPKFPNGAGPSGLGLFGKLGNKGHGQGLLDIILP